MAHVFERMKRALQFIARENPGTLVAVASHGCAIRNAVCWAKGLPLEEINQCEFPDNTGITTIEIDENGVPALLQFNDISHMPEELSRRHHRPAFDLSGVTV